MMTLVGKAAQRGALLDGSRLVVGVHLDDVAEAVQLVAVVVGPVRARTSLADVESRVLIFAVRGLPAMAAGERISGSLGCAAGP